MKLFFAGFCTKYYRLDNSSTACSFDPDLLRQAQVQDKKYENVENSGTIAPILTISLLILGTLVMFVYWMSTDKMTKYLSCFMKSKSKPKEPGISELEMMETTDPFMSNYSNIKTFSVPNNTSEDIYFNTSNSY